MIETWNPAKLNEKISGRDSWNPAILNEAVTDRDSWNPAILNESAEDTPIEFEATITVTYPSGATVTCSDGTTTLTADDNPMAFSIPNEGTWTVTSVLNGLTKTSSVVITTNGQEETVTIPFEATITVTYPEGGTLTASDGTTTLTADDNPMAFTIPNTGTWSLSCSANGLTLTGSVSIASYNQTETVDLTPVGATVTPTDSIPLLIACAGIGDSEITTIAGALADVDTLTAILESENAIDYLVRSTTFASAVTADSVAMTGIGAINYDADTLLADSTWLAAICNSAYLESVLNVKVPKMTGATTPSGEASSSTIYASGFEAWRAFDGNISGGSGNIWHSNANATAWIQYAFPSGDNINVKCIKIWDRDSSNITGTYSVNFKRSDNGETVKSFTYTPTDSGIHSIPVDTNSSGNVCRLEYTNPDSPNNYSIIAELQFYGRVDV